MKGLPEGGLLALDWGGAKVGYATCDEGGLVVTPRTSFARKARHEPWQLLESDRLALRKIIDTYQPGALVLGLPLNADGSESDGSKGARALAELLRAAFRLDVILVPEILTSWAARGRGATKPGEEDAEAAAVLLRDHLQTFTKT